MYMYFVLHVCISLCASFYCKGCLFCLESYCNGKKLHQWEDFFGKKVRCVICVVQVVIVEWFVSDITKTLRLRMLFILPY